MPTSEEAQPLGQDVGGFGLDQDLPAVQRHAGAHLPAHVEHGRLLLDARGRAQLKCSAAHEFTRLHTQAAAHRIGDIKDAPDVEWRVGAVVQCVARLVEGLGDVAVELLVLPVADLLGLHHPQGLMGDRGQVTRKPNDSRKQTNKLISVILSDYFTFVLQRNMQHF